MDETAEPENQGKFTAIHLSCDAANCVGAEDVLIQNCELTETGEGIDLGGLPKDAQVIGNHLHDMAGSAIRVAGGLFPYCPTSHDGCAVVIKEPHPARWPRATACACRRAWENPATAPAREHAVVPP